MQAFSKKYIRKRLIIPQEEEALNIRKESKKIELKYIQSEMLKH